MCVCVCVCVYVLCVGVARDTEWTVLGRLRREARTTVGLTGDGMGLGLLGL